MKGPVRFPIRLKILITLLFVVTGVVSGITFTMANLFHDDKKAYIADLVSNVAISTAEECRSILVGYQERLQVYARIFGNEDLSRPVKASVIKGFFEDFPELVGVVVETEGQEPSSVYNAATLNAHGLTREDMVALRADNPLPLDTILDGEVFIENSTISEKLPTLTLAIRHSRHDGTPFVVSGIVRLDSLWRVAARASSYEVFLADRNGVLLAHSDRKRVARRDTVEVPEKVKAISRQYSASVTHEYEVDGVEIIGGFASVSFGNLVSGAEIQKTAAYLATRDLLFSLMMMALGLLLLATIIGLFWAHRLTRPVEQLSDATKEIAKGKFDIEVNVDARDEIGALAGSFNQMASELMNRDSALLDAQAQLVQSEKMAAFGQLGAGIAHEVKNPLAGILGCAQLSLRKIEKDTPLEKNLLLIEKETRRCKTIIENLLRFARQEKAILEPIEVNPVVHDARAIVAHQLEINKVKLEFDLADDLPMIHGNGNQFQQVLMNLMINAQQAMEGEPGQIKISTGVNEAGQVEVLVRDTGPGIPDDIQKKLFEPFFTTKPGGKGTGLGLSVSFGIIKDHGGEIRIESVPGDGATFVITLPILKEHGAAPYAAAEPA